MTTPSQPNPLTDERRGAIWRRRAEQVVNLLEVPVGARVRLPDGGTGRVTDNPRDGSWIIVKWLTSPGDSSKVGVEEPIFAEEIYGVMQEAET